jgi:hypothetical protein
MITETKYKLTEDVAKVMIKPDLFRQVPAIRVGDTGLIVTECVKSFNGKQWYSLTHAISGMRLPEVFKKRDAIKIALQVVKLADFTKPAEEISKELLPALGKLGYKNFVQFAYAVIEGRVQ